MRHRNYRNRHSSPSYRSKRRPQGRTPIVLRAILFVGKLGLLILILPLLVVIMFVLAFTLPAHASGHVVARFFDRIMDWLVGPEAQEIVVTNKRPRGFLKF